MQVLAELGKPSKNDKSVIIKPLYFRGVAIACDILDGEFVTFEGFE